MNHERHGKKQEVKSGTVCSDWSSLPVEILEIIVEKLEHFRDRLSLASVCKDWKIPVTPRPLPWMTTLASNSPLIIFYGTSRSVTITFEFHEICSNVNEPCHLRPYKRSLEMPTCDDRFFTDHERNPEDSERDCFVVQPRIEESKLGWLVVSVSSYYRSFVSKQPWKLFRHYLFVYHPFSARSMSLPDLPKDHYTVTFSGSDPTSPDCVFFVIVSDYNYINVSILTWSPGQEAWKERYVIVENDDLYWTGSELCSVAWVDGIFYWCNRTHIESFNPSNGETKEIALPSNGGLKEIFYYNLFELKGEMFVHVDPYSPKEPTFFKFDQSEGTWIRRDDFLNDWLLFMSEICPSWYSVSGYCNGSFGRVFRNHDLRSHCQDDDVDMKNKTAIECLMTGCWAKTYAAIKRIGYRFQVEWLAPPSKTFG